MLLTLLICLQFCSVKANEFWVMNLNDQSGDSSYYQPPIPMYKRLRKVNLLPQKRVDCSCGCATNMRMPCRHILAVFDESKLIMWHVMWHKAFQTNYAREGQEVATNIYDNILKDVESQGVSYDGCEMNLLHDSDYPIFQDDRTTYSWTR
jgi:hypothetical protein